MSTEDLPALGEVFLGHSPEHGHVRELAADLLGPLRGIVLEAIIPPRQVVRVGGTGVVDSKGPATGLDDSPGRLSGDLGLAAVDPARTNPSALHAEAEVGPNDPRDLLC